VWPRRRRVRRASRGAPPCGRSFLPVFSAAQLSTDSEKIAHLPWPSSMGCPRARRGGCLGGAQHTPRCRPRPQRIRARPRPTSSRAMEEMLGGGSRQLAHSNKRRRGCRGGRTRRRRVGAYAAWVVSAVSRSSGEILRRRAVGDITTLSERDHCVSTGPHCRGYCDVGDWAIQEER
jgi:hypothetical protein